MQKNEKNAKIQKTPHMKRIQIVKNEKSARIQRMHKLQ